MFFDSLFLRELLLSCSILWSPPSNFAGAHGCSCLLPYHMVFKKNKQHKILHDFSLCSISFRWLPCRHSFDVPSPGKLLDSGDFLLMSHQSAEHRGHGLTARDHEDSTSTGHGFLAKLKPVPMRRIFTILGAPCLKMGHTPKWPLKRGTENQKRMRFFLTLENGMEWYFQSAEKRRKLDTGSCMVLSWSFMYFPSLHGRLREINTAFMLNAVLDDFRHVGVSENEVYQPFLAIK